MKKKRFFLEHIFLEHIGKKWFCIAKVQQTAEEKSIGIFSF